MRTGNSAGVSETLAKVREKIRQTQALGREPSEQNTKCYFIEPILWVLGWDIHDYEEVKREFKIKPRDNPVDYALFINKSPCLIIEAKRLGANLNDRRWISQTVNYANVAGVRWCVLTNGDEYRIYNSLAARDVEDKLFRTAFVTQIEDHTDACGTLDLLAQAKMSDDALDRKWNEDVDDRRIKAALEELITSADVGLIRVIRKVARELPPARIRASLRRAKVRFEYPAHDGRGQRSRALLAPVKVGGVASLSETRRKLAGARTQLTKAKLSGDLEKVEVWRNRVRDLESLCNTNGTEH